MKANPHYVPRRPITVALAFVFLIAIIFSPFVANIGAAASDLDPTFGAGGSVIATEPVAPKILRAVAIQRDGKIVVAGSGTNPPPQTWQDVALARYNPDGSLDQTFGTGGYVLSDFSSDRDEAYAIAIQSDGKIVVGGYTSSSMGKPRSLISRYTADGHLDTSIGSYGKIEGADFTRIYSIAVLPDDKIVWSGYATNDPGSYLPGVPGYLLGRLNADGTNDPSFNGNGWVLTTASNVYSTTTMAIQADGKIIIGAGATYAAGAQFTLLRYNTNGSLDSTFGNSGIATADSGVGYSAITALALQPDGRIVAAGNAANSVNGPFDFALARFESNGSRDETFNGSGIVTTDFFGNDDVARALVIRPDGQLVVVGYSGQADHYDFALAGYNVDGSADANFGNGGKATTDFAGGNDQAYAAALDGDGRLIVAGNTTSPYDQGVVARYLGDGFDLCLQDEGKGNILKIKSATGEYRFINCGGIVLGGSGKITRRKGSITLEHNTADRKVQANVDVKTGKASATVKKIGGGPAYTINDKNINNNWGTCH